MIQGAAQTTRTSAIAILLALVSATAVYAEHGKYAQAALAKFTSAEKKRAEGLAFMKKHPTREDLPGKPFAGAIRELNAAEAKLDRAEKKGESVGKLRKKLTTLREAYAAEYFEFVSPLILARAREGKERYVWSAIGTVRQIEKYVSSGPSESLAEQAKRIMAKGGEAEVRKYLDEGKRRLERSDFPKAAWNAKTAERLAKTPELRAEAAALRKAVEQKRAAAIERKQAAQKNRGRGYALMEEGKFREAAALFEADRKGFRVELAQCAALEEASGIADVHAACKSIRAGWKKGLTWKTAYWVNLYQFAPTYGLKRVETALEANPSDPALQFEQVLFHFAYENYPTVQSLIKKIEASSPEFADSNGVSIGDYRKAIEAIMANASAQSDYRYKRSQAKSAFARTRLDNSYRPAFAAWKRGVDTFLEAF